METKKLVLLVACTCTLVLTGSALALDPLLWDTGPPQIVLFDPGSPPPVSPEDEHWLGFSSGNVGLGLENRRAAMAFDISDPGGKIITALDADFWVAGATNVEYAIWNRTGMETAPVPGGLVSTGVLGLADNGVDDPRITEETDELWLHVYEGLNIVLPQGDYWISIYGDNAGSIAWITGAELVPEALERTAMMWRAPNYAGGDGFVDYSVGNGLLPGPDMTGDLDDVYNLSYRLYGTPEPATMVLLGLGGLAGLLRRRK